MIAIGLGILLGLIVSTILLSLSKGLKRLQADASHDSNRIHQQSAAIQRLETQINGGQTPNDGCWHRVRELEKRCEELEKWQAQVKGFLAAFYRHTEKLCLDPDLLLAKKADSANRYVWQVGCAPEPR